MRCNHEPEVARQRGATRRAALALGAAATVVGMTAVLPAPVSAQGGSQSAPAPSPSTPYSVRGVPLGVTIDEFRAHAIPADEGEEDLSTHCTNDPVMPRDMLSQIIAQDTADGIVTCEWWGRRKSVGGYPTKPEILWISLGDGKGTPAFDFISDRGTLRLFRVRFYANSTYSAAIRRGLTDRYGEPIVTSDRVRTGTGNEFDAPSLTWANASSSITFESPCRRLDRYCLTYRHTALGKLHDAVLAKRAQAAAERF